MIGRKRIADLAVEGVVIVGSILLAFALDAWWDTREQRKEEVQLLENLQTEFRAAGVQLDRYLFYHRATLSSVEGIQAAAGEAMARGRSSVDVPTIDLARTLIGPTFDPRTGTLNGLLASGKVGILRDPELRATLSAWPGLLAEASEEERASQNLIWDHLEPALRRQMDLTAARNMPVDMVRETCADLFFGRPCDGSAGEGVVPARWAGKSGLPVNNEIVGLFASRRQILDHGIDQLGPVREEIDHIVQLVEASLAY